MRNKRIQIMVEIALAVALAAVLNLWKIKLPWNVAGGTISLSMLPILIVSIRRGPVAGMVAGAIFGCIDLLYEPYIMHWAQVIFDYPLPYLLVGLSGFGAKGYARRAQSDPWKASLRSIPWMVLGGAGRFVAHVLSGVFFFAANVPVGQNGWIYSMVYNLSYVVPSLVASIVLAVILLPVLQKALPVEISPAHS